jgi:hypothetical protein
LVQGPPPIRRIGGGVCTKSSQPARSIEEEKEEREKKSCHWRVYKLSLIIPPEPKCRRKSSCALVKSFISKAPTLQTKTPHSTAFDPTEGKGKERKGKEREEEVEEVQPVQPVKSHTCMHVSLSLMSLVVNRRFFILLLLLLLLLLLFSS